MFQIGISLEVHARGGVVTSSVGWGLSTFTGLPWYRNLFGVIAQGAVGIRRFGLIAFGFFTTIQFVDMDGARKALLGAQIQNSSVHGQKNPSRAA